MSLESIITGAIARLDFQSLQQEFLDQNEFIVIKNFLNADDLQPLLAPLPGLRKSIHRNYIPNHKKGGSISRYSLDAEAPVMAEFYNSPTLWQFAERFADGRLLPCPDSDPHSYALYVYTEPGDHIGYHYDTSYYRGVRYTGLLGLVDRSTSKLAVQIHRDNPQRDTIHREIALEPGTFVLFNGDNTYHKVTPLGDNEERIVLTVEYLTSQDMHPWRRFISNMKDAIAYFGFRQVFRPQQSNQP